MRNTFRRLVTAAALGGAAATIGSSITMPAVAATVVPDGDDQLARVELTTLEPAVPEPGEPVVITGAITNVTDEALTNVQALVRYDRRPIATRSDIAQLSRKPDIYWGWRPGHIYDMVSGSLAPGETAPFEMELAIDTICAAAAPDSLPCLDMPTPGVYVIGVDANVTTNDGDRHRGGTSRTVVPWLISPDEPVPVAVIWPVVAEPEIGDDVIGVGLGGAAQAVPEEFAAILTAPGEAPVTWAVDPSAWTPAVAELIGADGELLTVPPAIPDIGALARVDRGLASRVAAATRQMQQDFEPGTVDRLDVGWSGMGAVNAGAIQAWASAGYDTIIAPRDAVVMPSESAVASIDGRLTAILTDPGLDSAIADASNPSRGDLGQDASARSAILDLRQRWLAETALAGAAPFGAGDTALVTAPPAGWSPSPEVAEALLDVWTTTEWIAPIGLHEVLHHSRPPRAAGTAPAAVLDPLRTGHGGLPGDYIRDVERLDDDLSRYHSLLADPATTSATSAQVTALAASTLWRSDLDTAREHVGALRRSVAEALAGVSVVVNPSNTLSGNSGVFPVNIANTLDHAVTVRLEFDPANQDRLAIEPVEARVPGGQQQTVQVRAEAVANGEVPVSVQLATVDGLPLGRVQQTIVNATDYGTIGWFVVGGSALLFIGGLSWRMVRGRRRGEP